MITIHCHQAVFTSMRSATGGGYRLVAAGAGLRPEEKKYITTRCPSHQGLCNDAADAVGVCAYPLPTGRYCITYTCNAGREYSGRGGQRIHTHILVLEAGAPACFQANPFELLRNFQQQGLAQPAQPDSQTLPELQLTVQALSDSDHLARSVATVGPDWIAAALDCLFQQKSAVLLGPCDPLAVTEAMLLSLPVDLRPQVSFSAGLRYSLARGFDLAVVTGQSASQLRPGIMGHSVSLLAAGSAREKPPAPKSEWCHLVANCWQDNAQAKLLDMTARHFPDTSPQALNRYARIALRRDQIRNLDTEQILELLAEHLAEPVDDELAASLAIAVTRDAVERLTPALTAANLDQLSAHWNDLAQLWKQADRTAGCFARLMGSCLKRAAQLDPAASAGLAADLVRTVHDQPAFALLQPPLLDLLDRLAECIQNADPRQNGVIKRHLDVLANVPDLAERVADLLASIHTPNLGHNPVAS